MSPEYAQALAASREAEGAYQIALTAFRAGRMSDADFLAAKATYATAQVAFDVAFEAEAARDEAPVVATENAQTNLFGEGA